MSVPVKYCDLVRAAEDPEYFERTHTTMHRNIKSGHWSVWPCECKPPCRLLTTERFQGLIQRFKQPPREARGK